MEDVGAMLVLGREVRADGGDTRDAGAGAEGAGDLLPELGHAAIALDLVIVEQGAQIGAAAQHITALLAQTFDEVAGRGLLDAALAARWRRAGWIAVCGRFENGVVTPVQVLDLGGGSVAR